jgi:hypothetical protein
VKAVGYRPPHRKHNAHMGADGEHHMNLLQLSQPNTSGPSKEVLDAIVAQYQDVILADIKDCEAITRQAESWIRSQMKDPNDPFPPAVIRETRCTRWRLVDVLRWQQRRIERAAADPKSNGERTAGLATAANKARREARK